MASSNERTTGVLSNPTLRPYGRTIMHVQRKTRSTCPKTSDAPIPYCVLSAVADCSRQAEQEFVVSSKAHNGDKRPNRILGFPVGHVNSACLFRLSIVRGQATAGTGRALGRPSLWKHIFNPLLHPHGPWPRGQPAHT